MNNAAPAHIQLVKVICAWCKWTMREGRLVKGKASHSICPTCAAKYFPSPDIQVQHSEVA